MVSIDNVYKGCSPSPTFIYCLLNIKFQLHRQMIALLDPMSTVFVEIFFKVSPLLRYVLHDDLIQLEQPKQ